MSGVVLGGCARDSFCEDLRGGVLTGFSVQRRFRRMEKWTRGIGGGQSVVGPRSRMLSAWLGLADSVERFVVDLSWQLECRCV